MPPAKLPAGRKTLVREENSLEQRWCAEKESSENVASIGSSQDSRLRGRHKRSDTIRVTACLVGYGCSNRDILPRLVAMRSSKFASHLSQEPCGCYRAYSLYREERGLWDGFEFNERRPGREVAIETGPFRWRGVLKCRVSAKCFPRNS